MTKDQIAEELLALSYKMQDIAISMSAYSDDCEWAKHHVELSGAASVAKQWGREILNKSK